MRMFSRALRSSRYGAVLRWGAFFSSWRVALSHLELALRANATVCWFCLSNEGRGLSLSKLLTGFATNCKHLGRA